MKDFNLSIEELDAILDWFMCYRNEGSTRKIDDKTYTKIETIVYEMKDKVSPVSLDCEFHFDY